MSALQKEKKNAILNNSDTIALIDSLSHSQCLFSLYGHDYIKQKAYTCNSCFTNGVICEYCYYHCHKNCNKNKKRSTYITRFACDCALELKHKVISEQNEEIKEDKYREVVVSQDQKERIIKEYIDNPELIKTNRNPIVSLEEAGFFEQHEKDKKLIYFKTEDNKQFYVSFSNIVYERLFRETIELNKLLSVQQWMLSFEQNSFVVKQFFRYINMLIHFDYINKYFQNVKALTTDDFLQCSFCELLSYRERILTQKRFCPLIKEQLIKKMVKLCSKALEQLSSNNNDDYLCFIRECAQYMLLDLEDIEFIINTYFSIKLEKEQELRNQVLCVDTLFILGKLYEMYVFEGYMKKGKSEYNHLFYNNEIGQKLLIIMVISSSYIDHQEISWCKYNTNYYNLKLFNHLFFYPFLDKQKPFDKIHYDLIQRLIQDNSYYQKKKCLIDISSDITYLRYEYKDQEETIDKIEQFNSLLKHLINYIKSILSITNNIKYRSRKHIKIVKKVNTFLKIQESFYIQNIDEIINDFIYANIDTSICKMILSLVYNNQDDKELFDSNNLSFLQMSLNILSLFLLSEKGIHYFTVGESFRYLILTKELAFRCFFFPLFDSLSSFLSLLPKQFIEQPINDGIEIINYNENKNTQIHFLKDLRKIYSTESYAMKLFNDILKDFLDFIHKELNKEEFFAIILTKDKKAISKEDKEKIKLLLAFIDFLSLNHSPMREEYYRYYEQCFDFFDHPEIENILKSDFFSMKKKKIIIQFMTVYWLTPLYTDYNIPVYPITNPMYAAYNRHSTQQGSGHYKENIDEEVTTEQLNEESTKMIENKIKVFQRIIKLINLFQYFIFSLPNTYNTNTKHYFDLKSFYKQIIRNIKLINNYIYYSPKKISKLILFPFGKLLFTLFEKEYILFKLFDIQEINQENIKNTQPIDFMHLKPLVEAMNKVLFKFNNLFKVKRYNSVYKIYMNNNKNDLFYKSYTPFSFITEKQEEHALFEVDENYWKDNDYFKEYQEMTKNQIDELKGHVLFSALKNNTEVEGKPFIFYFFSLIYTNYLNNIFPIAPEILNFYYKICSYDLSCIDSKVSDRKIIKNFFDKMKLLLPFLLKKCYNESSYFSGIESDNRNSFIVVTLIKFIELFGEGYNYNFHYEILKNASHTELYQFEKTPIEIEKEQVNNNKEEIIKTEETVYETEKDEEGISFNSKEYSLKNKIKKQYNPKIEDSENICIPCKQKKTLFEIIVYNLKLNVFRVCKGYIHNGPTPFDNNLIVIINSEIDFIVEFLYTFNYEHEELIDRSLLWLFFKIDYYKKELHNYLLTISENNKELSFITGRMIDLLIARLHSTNNNKISHYLVSFSYFKKMISHYNLLLESCSKKNKNLKEKINQLDSIENEDEYTNALIELYIWQADFRINWHMIMITKYSKILFLLEKKFNQTTINQTFENEKYQNNQEYIKQKGLYNFLKKILINIEFTYIVSDKEKKNYLSREEYERLKENKKLDKFNFIKQERIIDVMKKCIQINNARKDDTTIEEVAQKKYGSTFYILPYFTYYLTNQSKIRFEENVDRTSKSTKAKGLITYIESFVFEMIVNQYMFKKNTSISQWISKLNYFSFELINFGFICLHNMILLIHYYKSWTLDQASYDSLNTNEFNNIMDNKNWLLAIIQIVFLSFVLIIWYRYNYIQCYFNNLQIKYESKVPLFKRIKKFRILYTTDKPDFNRVLTKHFEHVPYSKKMKIAFLDSFFLNSEICIPLYTFILLLLYLLFHSPLFLVIPVLFLAHIFDTLSAIFQGVYSRFGHLFAVYIFTYLTIYIFMWTGFLFFSDLFKFDTINSQNELVSTEPFCTSSIQCLLFFINYGIRSGGGIGDLLGTPSFKDNYWFFMKVFFYEILFHLIIVMIFANVFLGLIADAFGELREAAEAKINDKENICFICQINSDECAIKGIDFEEHVTKKHNLWDYIYFLCYLYLKDENEYNLMEYKIMSSISEFNLSWIPYAGKEEDI